MASVFLIDDDAELASLVSDVLGQSGHEVSCLGTARNAIELIQAGTFDLLITDLVMPEKDGLELITELRRSGIDLPILAMSGAADADLLLHTARHLGATEVIFKPFSSLELIAAVDGLLKRQVEPEIALPRQTNQPALASEPTCLAWFVQFSRSTPA